LRADAHDIGTLTTLSQAEGKAQAADRFCRDPDAKIEQ
jgi:hypothetical protein